MLVFCRVRSHFLHGGQLWVALGVDPADHVDEGLAHTFNVRRLADCRRCDVASGRRDSRNADRGGSQEIRDSAWNGTESRLRRTGDGRMVDTVEPQRSAMAPGVFLKGFIAQLVLEGLRSISSRDPEVHRGLKRVVELLDGRVREILDDSDDVRLAGPWIATGNLLRLSPTGGVENWERALRSVQMTYTRIGGNDSDSVAFEIDAVRAKDELAHLPPADRAFVKQAATAFIERTGATA